MLIFLEDKTLDSAPGRLPGGPAILLADPGEGEAALALAGFDLPAGFPEAEPDSIHFESRQLYDYLALTIPDFSETGADLETFESYLTQSRLVLLGRGPVFDKLRLGLEKGPAASRRPAEALALLFNLLLGEETGLLQRIDEALDELEDKAAERKAEDHASEIILLRKELAAVKHYFDSLYELLDELGENRNEVFTKGQLQVFRAHKNKANRLINRTLNLREQLTQVREAFQNQLDISLNETMRFFTVITAVFLPLTLIAGWYGMNLRMPELKSALTYPIIIGVSLAFILISLIYCKRKGWF